jgi:hypothetical protein
MNKVGRRIRARETLHKIVEIFHTYLGIGKGTFDTLTNKAKKKIKGKFYQKVKF